MRKIFLGVALLAALRLSATDAEVAGPPKISAANAAKYYNQEVVATGKVVQVNIRPSVIFLSLDKPYPGSPLTIVIFHGHSQFYGDANVLRGKTVEISGKVKNFRNRPEIALDRTNQLTVLNLTNRPAPIRMAPETNAPPATTKTNLPEVM